MCAAFSVPEYFEFVPSPAAPIVKEGLLATVKMFTTDLMAVSYT